MRANPHISWTKCLHFACLMQASCKNPYERRNTGVCAGHGGPGAAAFVQENLWKTLKSNHNFDSDIKQALGALMLFIAMHRRLNGSPSAS